MRPWAGNRAKSRVVPKMRFGPWTKFRTVPKRKFGTLSKSGYKPNRTKSGSRNGGVNRLTVPRMRTRTGSDSGFNRGTVPKLRKGNRVNSPQQSQSLSGFLASDLSDLSDLGEINSHICNELQGKFQEIFGQLKLECGPSARRKNGNINKGGSGYRLGSTGGYHSGSGYGSAGASQIPQSAPTSTTTKHEDKYSDKSTSGTFGNTIFTSSDTGVVNDAGTEEVEYPFSEDVGEIKPLEHNFDFERMFQQMIFRGLQEHLVDY